MTSHFFFAYVNCSLLTPTDEKLQADCETCEENAGFKTALVLFKRLCYKDEVYSRHQRVLDV
jgi:hypothetical protein